MATVNQQPSAGTSADGQGERKSRRHPPGYRWLSVLLPQQTFNNLHIQARLSNMSFREYMEQWCQEAFPLNGPTVSDGRPPEQAPPAT